MFFKAVVQAVVQALLILGTETWMMIPIIGRALGGGSNTG